MLNTIIKMKIILVCILKIYLVSFVSTEGGSGSVPPVMCTFSGLAAREKNYKFDVEKIPDRCKSLQYGVYYMDAPPSKSNQDTADIAKAVGKKLSIYLYVTFQNSCEFPSIVDPNNGSASYAQYVTPMLTYVRDNQITGVILDCLDIFAGNITDYPKKLNDLMCKMKKEKPGLQVGLTLYAHVYGGFTDNSFDFSITNNEVAMYVIDTFLSGLSCSNEAIKNGILPITTEANNVAALQGICNAVHKSAMQQDKLVISLPLSVQVAKDKTLDLISYTQYCSNLNASDPSALYCPDSIDRFYKVGEYVKNYFKGILLYGLTNDDFAGACNCSNLTFPVANAYIDGFLSAQKKPCAALA